MCITTNNLIYDNTNNTKGSLCATAYRTLGTDDWSFKYYRYDARGRVIKMWNYIAGLGMKVTKYKYNSQNQMTKLEYQNETDTDYKRFLYSYDYAGRMIVVNTEESGPPPDYNYAFAIYKYNENSQIDSVLLNDHIVINSYTFNNRNWITTGSNNTNLFEYTLSYLTNGNISNQTASGSYKYNFSDIKDIRSNFTYDKSNRLKKLEKYNSKYCNLTGDYSYDADGNFTTLTRSYNGDNFAYEYYTGTNRLKKVSGTTDQYTYDYNGNQTSDVMNYNYDIKYDHRNLIYEMKNTSSPNFTFLYRYKYDEAGNRIRKTIYRSDIQPPPPTGEDNPTGWIAMKDEYYSRDAAGKEIAVYQSYSLDYWNVWGTSNEGRIKSTGMKYFYLKDHLGSIRAVINESNTIVQSQDYDPWGHLARSWDTTTSTYKFTGKERDNESNYDYFGARYYDSRVGRWGQTEPLLDKYLSFSPYQYGLLNPIRLFDVNGRDVYIFGSDSKATVEYMNKESESTGLTFSINNDGKLSVIGKPLNDNAKILYNAINLEDITVGMFTLRRDVIDESDQSTYMSVGTFYGNFNFINNNSIEYTIAIQYFNLPQALAYNDAGGSSVAVSAFHEIKEAFIGAVLFPGKSGFKKAHTLTKATDPEDLEEPFVKADFKRKIYYINKNEKDNKEAEKYYPDYTKIK